MPFESSHAALSALLDAICHTWHIFLTALVAPYTLSRYAKRFRQLIDTIGAIRFPSCIRNRVHDFHNHVSSGS